jgi:porin
MYGGARSGGAVFGAAAVAFLAALLAETGESFAGDNNGGSVPAWSLPDALRQLTDWNGARSKLDHAGLKFSFTYFADGFDNPTGGVQQGPGYDGRFGAIVDADLEKLAGWSGGLFHASVHQIHGTEFSAKNLDNLMTVSGAEEPTSTRLFNLWIGQDIGRQVNVRVGQFTAAQEFFVSDSASLFVNSTFGWPLLNSLDMPSGGPNYPEATPGIRVRYAPTREISVKAAIFNGDPAGPGSGNPVERDPHGLAFRVNDPPFFIAEFTYAYDQNVPRTVRENPNQERNASRPAQPPPEQDMPNAIKFGAWLNTGWFADQRFNSAGGLLAVSGPPLQHRTTTRSTGSSIMNCGTTERPTIGI